MSENPNLRLSEKLRELGEKGFGNAYLKLSISGKFTSIDAIAQEMGVEPDLLKSWIQQNQELLTDLARKKEWEDFNSEGKK